MRKIKILILSPNTEFTNLSRQICSELNAEVEIIEEIMDEAVIQSREVFKRTKIDAIVGREGTAALIKREVNIPVITAGHTEFAILDAFWRAKKIEKKIGYFGFKHQQIDYNFESIEKILDIEIHEYFYETLKDIEGQVNKIIDDKVTLLVCGAHRVINLAEQKGIRGIWIKNSKSALVRAIQDCIDIVEIRNMDLEKEERLKTIIHSVSDGIITLDESENINVVNNSAEKIFNFNGGCIVGKKPAKARINKDLKNVLVNKVQLNDTLIKVNKVCLLANRKRVKVNEQTTGTIFTFQDITKIERLERQIRKELYSKGLVAKYYFKDIIHKSKIMEKVIKTAQYFAKTDSTILVSGESGTGKELFAQSIHNDSLREKGPFVAINCSALPENILESELFGYEEGAFTGARKGGKVGLFELAHKGTIFLDEIGQMSLMVQNRLLRVLQEKEVMRVGGDRIIPVDIRVISATNQDLTEKIRQGLFREDLYYRLNILSLDIPPLRQRKEDLQLLIDHISKKFYMKMGKNSQKITKNIMEEFYNHDWPGNVRELENLIESYFILNGYEQGENYVLDRFKKKSSCFREIDEIKEINEVTVQIDTLENMILNIISQLYQKLDGNKTELMQTLDISRTTLWRKIKELE